MPQLSPIPWPNEAICQLKARYFASWTPSNGMIGRQYSPTTSRAVDSTVSNGGSGAPRSADRSRCLRRHIRHFLDGVSTVHHGHMPEITLVSPTEATGIWSMEDKIKWPDGRTLHGYGLSRATASRTEQWRIARSNQPPQDG